MLIDFYGHSTMQTTELLNEYDWLLMDERQNQLAGPVEQAYSDELVNCTFVLVRRRDKRNDRRVAAREAIRIMFTFAIEAVDDTS